MIRHFIGAILGTLIVIASIPLMAASLGFAARAFTWAAGVDMPESW